MARLLRSRHSEREAKVLQGRLSIEAGAVISDSERGWTCDPLECKLERSLPDISPPHSCNEGFMTPLLSGPPRDVPEFRFLCCCPRVLAFGNAHTDRRSVQLCEIFFMSDFQEF
jgi:hypothetical protein